jgi:hypothetical protein
MASSYAASPGAAGRPLTDFEQVLVGVIASEPCSGYANMVYPVHNIDTGWVTVALITANVITLR